MAQVHYEAFHAPHSAQHPAPEAATGGGVGKFVNLLGAALSVALVAGVGIWSYRLMVRDVSGIPVIQALDVPMRVAPDDPGGRQAAYQGLAVNTVAAEGEAAGTSPVIALAPPPVELSAEDRTAVAMQSGQGEPLAPITAPQPVGDVASIQTPATAPTELALLNPGDLISPDQPGVSRSLWPQRRPASLAASRPAPQPLPSDMVATDAEAEAVLQEIVTRMSAPSTVEIDPVSLVPGTRLVQLGAYDTEDEARAAWASLVQRFPDFLADRGRVIESASAGGRTFFRLRAHGFADEPEARRFCSVFLADNADCIPVLIR